MKNFIKTVFFPSWIIAEFITFISLVVVFNIPVLFWILASAVGFFLIVVEILLTYCFLRSYNRMKEKRRKNRCRLERKMSDLIRRSDLLAIYEGCEGFRIPIEVVIQNIKDIPSVIDRKEKEESERTQKAWREIYKRMKNI